MVSYAERVGDDRQRGIHGRARYEEARVDDIEIIEVVGPAVHVEHGSFLIVTEPDRAALVGRTRDGNFLSEIQMRRQQMVLAAQMVEHALELCGQAAMRFEIVL